MTEKILVIDHITDEGRKAFEPVLRWLENGAPHVDIDGRPIDAFDMSCGIEQSSCGTACCIAGALVQFNSPGEKVESMADNWLEILDEALKISGITFEKQALQLFAVDSSEEGPVFAEKDIRQYAKPEEAAKVLRHFLETGEVDWSLAKIEVPPFEELFPEEDEF